MISKDIIQKNEMYAIIPARAGSKGIKNKNIRCIKGYPMMAYAIAVGKLCPYISRVIVSTDSPEYAKIANYYGAETPFLRPEEISRDDSTDLEFMEHAIGWFADNEGKLPEYFMHLRPTSPLRDMEHINKAAKMMMDDRNASSLRSSHPQNMPPYKMFLIKDDGYYRSFVDGITLDEANNPRQKFKGVYAPDGYVDVLRTEFIIDNHLIHGDRSIPYIIEDALDIDAKSDFEYTEYCLEKNKPEILHYLEENYKPLSETGLQD